MSKPKVLIQLDSDHHASIFDAVVAVDSGIDQLLQYHDVEPTQVRELVHGAMFTRGPKDLHRTAIFVGGSDVMLGERMLAQVKNCFFGPMRVSVMLDANGANTTAAAAVLAASRHVELSGANVLVLAATGPVGQRAVRLLARCGAQVRVASRSLDRASAACDEILQSNPEANVVPIQTGTPVETAAALAGAEIVLACGAAGVELLSEELCAQQATLRVAIDLNAVPPAGIAGIEVTAKAVDQNGVICYGAIGVGGDKMRIHTAALRKLFESNDQVFDAEEIFEIGRSLVS